MDYRLIELRDWLTNTLSIDIMSLAPASEDASFRRYFRLITESSSSENTFIAMDAPPTQESLDEFIAIDQALVSSNLHAPKIHSIDLEKGFLLLEDLGSRTYLDELSNDSDMLYNDAITALISIQNLNRSIKGGFDIPDSDNAKAYIPPLYDHNVIEQELDLFVTWYCDKHLQTALSQQQLAVWDNLKHKLVEVFNQQPQAWVHRDYHSRNLMITNENSPGIIDFQDMVWGPISYDIASLFKDCYIEWPRETQLSWLRVYYDQYTDKINEDIEFTDLIRWFDLTGLQRHLKVLGIFCRLNYRDSKSHYLLDLPLVKKYVQDVLDLYPELSAFKQLFKSLP